MTNIILGIDISKATFDVALLNDNTVKTKKFNNSQKGFSELIQWLENKSIYTAHACMEATGGYEAKLANYLYDNNFKVSVVNPARVKGFSLSKLLRVKTDKADSELIAQFCLTMQPSLWRPAALHIQELQQWIRRLDCLIANKNQEANRLKLSTSDLATRIQLHIDFLDKEIQEIEVLITNHINAHKDLKEKSKLLASIPGIGERTAAVILGFLNVDEFSSAKQVTAFVGLNPKPKQSGSSIRGVGKISKTGDSSLRKAFYMPALVAIKHNSLIKDFCQRLTDAGKPKMVIVIAAMRKLLHIIYGVLKNETSFNTNMKAV